MSVTNVKETVSIVVRVCIICNFVFVEVFSQVFYPLRVWRLPLFVINMMVWWYVFLSEFYGPFIVVVLLAILSVGEVFLLFLVFFCNAMSVFCSFGWFGVFVRWVEDGMIGSSCICTYYLWFYIKHIMIHFFVFSCK